METKNIVPSLYCDVLYELRAIQKYMFGIARLIRMFVVLPHNFIPICVQTKRNL